MWAGVPMEWGVNWVWEEKGGRLLCVLASSLCSKQGTLKSPRTLSSNLAFQVVRKMSKQKDIFFNFTIC